MSDYVISTTACISFAGVEKQPSSTAIICGELESTVQFNLTILLLNWFIRCVVSYLKKGGSFGGSSVATVYYSLDYQHTLARNSYTVCFGENQFGIIQYFLEVNCFSHASVLAVVNVLSVQSYHNLPHLYTCKTTNSFKAINADTLQYKCVYVSHNGTQFIGLFPSWNISMLS